ncbi:MAG: asparagine synthase (glutamine-hydrolyzing) [Cytophagales bacterium]|nr:asparagine synthase (glutamine-hydrolyzing) [Cytophagales bacterium]
MCGIAGIFDTALQRPVDRQALVAMTEALRHRGPDDEATLVEGPLGFGFRRLSIIDLAHGQQPFYSEDESVVLVCNGEIYNYRELRAELVAKGYRFKTNCDVEVIVHLYQACGTDLLGRLNGQFAFALFDKRRQALLLARDHFGICPLFYTLTGGVLLFASEIKALLRHPLVKREVDLTGLDQLFSFPGVVSPFTMFKGINSLKPGHCLWVENATTTLHEYWDLDYPRQGEEGERKPDHYYEERLEELLLQSVRYRLNADVPVGFYLSGGLDSSLVGAMMRKVNDKSYPSFSVVYPGDREIDESRYQKLLSRHVRSVHHEVPFDSDQVHRGLANAVFFSETPLKETYNTCSLALSARVRDSRVKVILSGEGSDEFFGGYYGYRFDAQRGGAGEGGGIKDIDEILEDELRQKLWGDPGFFYEKKHYEFTEITRALYSDRVNERHAGFNCLDRMGINHERLRGRHPFHKRSYLDLKLRLSDHLVSDHCDRVSYANSVEGRYPFLDVNVVEFARTIPTDLMLNNAVEKYILKKIARKYVPHEICDRQKYGWVAPGSPELLRCNIDWINDLLSHEQIRRQGYFNPDTVERLKKMYRRDNFRLHTSYESDLLIVVLTFNIFLELFKLPGC